MGTILTGAVLTVIIALVTLLALLRAGIRRQGRVACLACRPPGLSAALARRVSGLYVRQHTHYACPATRTAHESPPPALAPVLESHRRTGGSQ